MKDENGADGSTPATAIRAQTKERTPPPVRLIEFQPWRGLTDRQEKQYARCKERLAKLLLTTWPSRYGWLHDSKETIANEAAHDVMLDVHLLRLPRPFLDGEFPQETRNAAVRRRADLCAGLVRRMYADKRSAAQTIPMGKEALDVAAEPTASTFPLKLILDEALSHISSEDAGILGKRIDDGLSFEDIAKEAGCDRTTVYRRVRQCRRFFKAAMENHFFFADCCNKPAQIAENVSEE